MGQFHYNLDPDTRRITRRLEKLQLKMINRVPSPLIKLILIYIYIYIYIYVCVCVCEREREREYVCMGGVCVYV